MLIHFTPKARYRNNAKNLLVTLKDSHENDRVNFLTYITLKANYRREVYLHVL